MPDTCGQPVSIWIDWMHAQFTLFCGLRSGHRGRHIRRLGGQVNAGDVWCWEDDDGSTCTLPDGHVGPHVFTPDSEITVHIDGPAAGGSMET